MLAEQVMKPANGGLVLGLVAAAPSAMLDVMAVEVAPRGAPRSGAAEPVASVDGLASALSRVAGRVPGVDEVLEEAEEADPCRQRDPLRGKQPCLQERGGRCDIGIGVRDRVARDHVGRRHGDPDRVDRDRRDADALASDLKPAAPCLDGREEVVGEGHRQTQMQALVGEWRGQRATPEGVYPPARGLAVAPQ